MNTFLFNSHANLRGRCYYFYCVTDEEIKAQRVEWLAKDDRLESSGGQIQIQAIWLQRPYVKHHEGPFDN